MQSFAAPTVQLNAYASKGVAVALNVFQILRTAIVLVARTIQVAMQRPMVSVIEMAAVQTVEVGAITRREPARVP